MIYEYKMRLLCRRIERLFHIIFPSSDVVFYVFLLIAWLIFFVICYLLRKECITVVDLLWELKGGIFTSIIVTIIVKVSANLTKYSNSIKEQHVVYTDAMHDFTKYLCGVCDDSMWSHYMPLYNGICLNYTKEFF